VAGIIETCELTKIYNGRVLAVDGVSFDVEEGEIFGFLGPNGAGKSTTILMLITLVRPTSGQATVCGHDVAAAPDRVRSQIGYVSQDIAVDENLTGRENLGLQARLYHLEPQTLKRRSAEVLEMVDLADRADDLVSTYSGGMRKRLDIAEGLIHRPRVLFLDEPTLGLDIQTRRRIWEYVERLRAEERITIFLTTHYMDEADALCDRVAIIDRGTIAALGTPDELKRSLGGEVLSVSAPGPSGTPRERILERLRALELVETAVADADSSYTLVVRNGESAIPQVMGIFASEGTEVQAISLKRPSLDDVFLKHTGRELRESGGAHDYRRTALALRRARR